MAHKKAGGSTRNGRTSKPKYLGVKCYGGEYVSAGSIIIRQRGTPFHPGLFVGRGKDDTLFAKASGFVKFSVAGANNRSTVSIIPTEQAHQANNAESTESAASA